MSEKSVVRAMTVITLELWKTNTYFLQQKVIKYQITADSPIYRHIANIDNIQIVPAVDYFTNDICMQVIDSRTNLYDSFEYPKISISQIDGGVTGNGEWANT